MNLREVNQAIQDKKYTVELTDSILLLLKDDVKDMMLDVDIIKYMKKIYIQQMSDNTWWAGKLRLLGYIDSMEKLKALIVDDVMNEDGGALASPRLQDFTMLPNGALELYLDEYQKNPNLQNAKLMFTGILPLEMIRRLSEDYKDMLKIVLAKLLKSDTSTSGLQALSLNRIGAPSIVEVLGEEGLEILKTASGVVKLAEMSEVLSFKEMVDFVKSFTSNDYIMTAGNMFKNMKLSKKQVDDLIWLEVNKVGFTMPVNVFTYMNMEQFKKTIRRPNYLMMFLIDGGPDVYRQNSSEEDIKTYGTHLFDTKFWKDEYISENADLFQGAGTGESPSYVSEETFWKCNDKNYIYGKDKFTPKMVIIQYFNSLVLKDTIDDDYFEYILETLKPTGKDMYDALYEIAPALLIKKNRPELKLIQDILFK